jgi:hypothetical protein
MGLGIKWGGSDFAFNLSEALAYDVSVDYYSSIGYNFNFNSSSIYDPFIVSALNFGSIHLQKAIHINSSAIFYYLNNTYD